MGIMNVVGNAASKGVGMPLGDALKYGTTDYSKLISADIASGNKSQLTSDLSSRQNKIDSFGLGNSVQSNADLLKSLGYNDGSTQMPLQTAVKYNDNSDLINSKYASLISAIKAEIQQQKNAKQQQINNLDQTYDPQRATSEVQRNSDLRSVLEQNANAGDRGGVGRQNALDTQTAADNRLNSINLNETNERNSLQNDMSNLDLQQAIQEGQLGAQQISDLLGDRQNSFNNDLALKNYGLNEASTNANVAKTNADTVYQNLVNSNYSTEEAAKIAGILASNQSVQLDNDAKAITNKYQAQILQGQIDGQALQNAYQKLVNAGYDKQQAADLAAKYASVASSNANTAMVNAETQNLKSGLTKQGKSTTPLPKSSDSLYNSTYSSLYGKYNNGQMDENSLFNYLQNIQGLSSQQKADIYNAIVPQ